MRAVALVLLCALSQAAFGQSTPASGRPAVLIIFADDPSQPWIQPMEDGISRVLYSRGVASPDPYFEYLDAVRFPDKTHRDQSRQALRDKYGQTRFSLIVPVTGAAIEFVNDVRDELWPGVPVLFTQYNASRPVGVPVRPHDSVLGFEFSMPAALETMKTVFPGTTHVAAAWNGEEDGSGLAPDVVDDFRRAGLEPIDLSGLPLNDLLSRLAHLPEHTLVNLGVSGGPIGPATRMNLAWPLCEQATTTANRPTFMIGSHFFGCGVVGGLMRNFGSIGRIVGDEVLEVLEGREAANVVIPLAAFTELEFDARQLERWHVDERTLPPGSVIRFAKPSLWRDYRPQVIATAGTVVIQLSLIVGLFYQRRQRRRAELESRRNLALAARIDRRVAIGALAGAIAHELNQPLSSILYNVTAAEIMIASGRGSPDALNSLLRDIRTEDVLASEIVQRQRAMLQSHELDKRPTDIYAVVRESLATVAHEAAMRQVRVIVDAAPSACVVLGDAVLLQQVVVNLVLNAMHAVADQPPDRRRVTVQAALARDGVEVSVRDAGTGLPDDIAARLFEPFLTTKADGIGIGLTIARTIIEAHGGTITAENNADGGATFRFTVPAVLNRAFAPAHSGVSAV